MKGNKLHYPWWGYIRAIIQDYPAQKDMELSGATRNSQEAVQAAVNATERMKDGEKRLEVIRLTLWEGTHTLEGAANTIPCDRSTAARWKRRFFEDVARNRGLLD